LSFSQSKPGAITMTDSLGQMTSIQFSDVQINQTIPEATFQYVIPEGVDLIDDR
jgi:outer membrane lipoprotein-sorting protein